jgi:RNA polymerase sigma factor (sigma-70 family)
LVNRENDDMTDGRLGTAINELRQVADEQSGCALADAQLLEAFVARRDEASFEALVWRHGTMVFNLCRRILRDSHEAEDAFQATFLVFARKAGSIGRRAAIGSWLYKVAYRIALRVRAKTARQRVLDDPQINLLDDLPAPEPSDDDLWNDLRPVLDEEISRLPEKYRAPFVLCYLQGRTNDEAAQQLGCPKGTILSRLSRGRDRLRARLVQRGLALSASGLTITLFQNSASAAVPATLSASTAKAATSFAAGKTAMGAASASVVSLTEGVLRTMILTKLKFTAAVLLAFAILGTGAGWLTREALAQRSAPAKPDEAPQRGRDVARATDVAGKVVAVAKDGKSFTVEIPVPGRNREEEPKKVDVKIGDKTAVHYRAVAPNAARPTEGYFALVRLAEGATDLAAEVTFQGLQNFRAPDLGGKVVGFAKDGKTIQLELSTRGRGEEGKTVEIKLGDKTQIVFSQVAKDGAKLAEGLFARVWLLNGSKDAADIMHFSGSEQIEERGGPHADVTGKVVAMSNDGNSVTVAIQPQVRGDEPTKMEIKLGDKSAVVYQNVGPDGAKMTEGYMARIWLENGSKDRAAKISFAAPLQERASQITGKVIGVGKDGKSITLEIQAGRAEKAKQLDVKIGDNTRISYTGVGPDEARLTEGLTAQVRLEEGSTNNAVQIMFNKPGAERGGNR